PQIVKEEEEGLGNGRSGGWEEIEGGEESDATTVAAAAAVEEEVGMDTEMQDEEVEAEASEEGLPSMPSRPTRATSRSFLLSLYRFFSSHLGISSPSTVASLLASYPQLLHFNPTNNFLPSVRLLQSFGISLADIVHITVRGSVWLRSPLPQINNKLEFLLDKVGEEAAGRVARTHPQVLILAKENMQGKVAVLVDLIGRENAVRVVALFPKILSSSEDVSRESFRELVLEVEEALECSGEEGSGTHRARELVVDLVVKYPSSIHCSWKENLKPKVEYLKRDMGLSIMEVLAYPQFLAFSLDRRIKPRHVALVRMGYAIVAHEMVIRLSVGGRKGVSIDAGEEEQAGFWAAGGPILWALLFSLVLKFLLVLEGRGITRTSSISSSSSSSSRNRNRNRSRSRSRSSTRRRRE
ncbi:unnamed protein product, partial [Closterium sp. NIES-54]